MLTESTVSYVFDLAQQLREAGVGVSAIPHTPLDNLVTTANPSFTGWEKEVKGNAKDVVVGLITGVTRNADEMSPHTAAVSALSQHLADNVTRHISTARSIVKPAVIAYAEEVQKRAEAYRNTDPMDGFKINKVYLPEPLLSESLLDDLKVHKTRNIPGDAETLPIGMVTDEELIGNLYTGSASVDKEIATWVSTVDTRVFREVWARYFNGGVRTNIPYHVTCSYADSLNGILALYLYSRKLSANPAPVQGLTPLAYSTKLTGIENYAGAVLHSYMREIEIAQRTERLVMESTPSRKTITLYGPTHDKYMEEGGSVEVILGLMASGSSAVSLEGVKAIETKCLEAWNRYITMSNYNNTKNRAEILRNIYIGEFVSSLNEMDPFEKEYHDKHPGFADHALKLSKDFISKLKEEELENISCVAMTVIAKYRFGYTQAFQILSDIEDALKANPNLDPREAATIATINLVSDYVSAQMLRI